MARVRECKSGTALRTFMVALLIVTLLACGLPTSVMNESAWGDEVEDELISDAQEDDEIAGEQGAPEGSNDVIGDGESSGEPDGASGLVELSDEERRFMEGLASLEARLDEELGALETSRASFDAARADFARGAFARDAVLNAGKDATERIEDLEQRRLGVLMLIRTVQEELMQSEEFATIALMTAASGAADVELRHELLERLMIAESKKIRQALSDQRRLRVEMALDEASAYQARRELRVVMRPINMAAYHVEQGCAQVRQCVKDVRQAAEGMSGAHPELLETRDAALSRADAARAMVVGAEQAIGAWYDEVDAKADAQDAISFGEGMDFSLPEDEFVETWGAAIDAFFAQRAQAMSAIPLRGYGRAMATSAYRHKIDPRLCAAVSIAESSGGQLCIKPYNAWGWGAADNDPYGLAAEWDSFEQAIEAWHEGMATSTSGLATAKSVSELGAVYCSSPAWGATVIEQMELISSFVR